MKKKNMFLQAFQNRKDTYIKPRECTNCNYRLICDGIEENLLDINKLNPSNITKNNQEIKDIDYFRTY